MALGLGMAACTDLDEKVYDRVDASAYYQDETSIKGAVAAIYGQTSQTLAGENFFHLSEYPADQITWRVWNGGLWGWDEAEKTVLSWHNWNSESTIIKNAWNGAWTAVGLANLLLSDLQSLDATSLGMSADKLAQYVAEVRTLRAWNYYCIFELWGGALPLNTSASSDVPGTADPDWNTSCKKIYNFIATELDETAGALAKDDANHTMVNRANQAMNRLLKARLLLNAEVFIGEQHYDECEALSKEIISGTYGSYQIDDNYRNLYSIDNVKSPEVVLPTPSLTCEPWWACGMAMLTISDSPTTALAPGTVSAWYPLTTTLVRYSLLVAPLVLRSSWTMATSWAHPMSASTIAISASRTTSMMLRLAPMALACSSRAPYVLTSVRATC